MMHKELEVYVVMIAKSVIEEEHLADVKKVFKWLRSMASSSILTNVLSATSSKVLDL